MYYKMRRIKQQLSFEKTEEIFKNGSTGVLSLAAEDGCPYGVPVNYLYDSGKIYIHSAQSGHKIQLLETNKSVSFCVIAQDRIVAEELTTYYMSAIAMGEAVFVEDDDKKRDIICRFALKYVPEEMKNKIDEAIMRNISNVKIIEINVNHMTGKAAIELI